MNNEFLLTEMILLIWLILKTINIADLSLGKQINCYHRRIDHVVVSFSFDMLIFVILFINQINEILKRKINKNKRFKFWLIFVIHYISCNDKTIAYFIQMTYIVSYSCHSEYVIKNGITNICASIQSKSHIYNSAQYLIKNCYIKISNIKDFIKNNYLD